MKKLLTILFVALLAMGVNAHGVVAQKAAVSGVWLAEAYCTTEGDAELLSRMMTEKGKAGYAAVITAPGISCWDSRILSNIPVPRVILIEKQWRVVTPMGQKFDFWTVLDETGLPGWVWFLIKEPVDNGV